jgi:hypothetical protein
VVSSVVFYIFIDKVLMKLNEANIPTKNGEKVSKLIFVDDLLVGGTSCVGMQRVISCIKECCDELELNQN